ncbi:MAG: hypothetical protein AABX47_00470 [Nanoarchaeota archaeon]
METETHQIMTQLTEIKNELDLIRDRLRDVDVVLTVDDYLSLDEAENDLRSGKTKRL